jgi:hypothetical protein
VQGISELTKYEIRTTSFSLELPKKLNELGEMLPTKYVFQRETLQVPQSVPEQLSQESLWSTIIRYGQRECA